MSSAVAATAARARRLGERRPAAVLAPLLAGHFAVVAAVALTAEREGWRFGGGESAEWAAARALGRLDVAGAAGYGAPALYWPFALGDALPVVVVLQVAFGGTLLLLAVHGIASRIAGPLFGHAAALAWVAAPLPALAFFYPGQRTFQGVPYDDYRGLVLDTVLPAALGLSVGAAYASLVAVAAAAWLVVRALDRNDWNDVVLAGLVAGVAVGIRPLNAIFLPAPLLALAAARRPKQALAFAAALVPALATLALWRWASPVDLLGDFRFGRYDFWANRVHFRGAGWSSLLVGWIAVAGAFALVRKAPVKGLLVAGWLAAYVVLGGSLESGRVLDAGLFPLVQPAFPAFVLLTAGLLLLVPPLGRPTASPPVAERRLRSTRGLLAGAAALALYPLALVALAAAG